MAFVNNVMIIRRDVISRITQLYRENRLLEEIDRIPIDICKRIRNNERCCKHKARAVVKYKVMAIMGYGLEDEKDELDQLSHYARQVLHKKSHKHNYLTVVDEACTSCVKSSYVVTNLCKGCIAQPCMNNCPKKAISRDKKGKAEIDPKKCVNCGICKDLCPYHTIIYLPIPCEESCPVGAIKKDKNGAERIDEEKCILCGKCVNACPFGSIIEKTELFPIMQLLMNKNAINAIIAPSIFGQFQAAPGAIVTALHQLGFSNVIEVAEGATQTTIQESEEFVHKLNEGQPFMTTSCCPSWVLAANHHVPEILPFVSTTPSPMAFTARTCKENNPGQPVVFIGPCIAKRKEGKDNPDVDYVMTFEELACLFAGWDIVLPECETSSMNQSIDVKSRKYCFSGGVADAVKTHLGRDVSVKAIDGINKKQLRLLASYAKNQQAEGQLIEVMSCEGGCIAGPSGHEFPKTAIKYFNQNIEKLEE
jgi:[FeFe] hydrogenase (group B1/B3)